ncbi:alpha/beta hydrolase [Streptomyces natalensis]|uniref:Lysophospholipase n=1 Tax=Streptomyces natalensis ATCC 27448 TaxID=1240678 RepID=A0A0D7CK30_9ACTN|nr:alpha/beta fold hydrolase [Streptomyces natalensis]KIZ16594.1 lysophospholipase [Streptomyces natalensis ATCC 27448]
MTHTVRTERVTFDSDGETLVGTLYRPDGQELRPAIVVTGSWTTVKEQMAAVYAQRMAEAGFVALAFDFTGFGESGGQPRQLESPARKIADIHHAITFLAQHSAVDAGRIGALGVCASSGYTAVNAADDPRVRSLVLIAPWLHDADLVQDIYGGADEVQKKMGLGLDALAQYEKGAAAHYVPAVSLTDPQAAMFGPFDYYLDEKRGAVPAWDNRFAVMSWPQWLTFDPHPAASRIKAPTVLVHSRDGAIPQGAEKFHAALGGPNALVWTSGTQFDFYDQDAKVTEAAGIAARHFTETLT